MMHNYGMIYVLGYRLENAIPKSKLQDLSWIPCEEVDKDFRESLFICIQRHTTMYKFNATMMACYGPIFAALLLVILIFLSPTLVQIMTVELLDYKAVVAVILVISFLFINCFIGQTLIDLSSSIFEKAYDSSWYHCSPHLQKLLLLIMRRSDKPCHIGFYDIYVVSFLFFRSVLQTSISYCMVLKQFQ
ncbi:odorant receptor 22c-like [Prorops nasuta]|uniref:odorant receptor 22c-like n=1 Tax=Prorops nasuta TaxID=863751 RepID=UPI0034CE0ADF